MRLLGLFIFMFFMVPVSFDGSLEAEETSVLQKVDKDKPWRKEEDKQKKKKKKSVSDKKKFKRMARDLLGQPHWSERYLRLLNDDIPKIAIHPFKSEDVPVSLSEIQTYVDGFMYAMVREADDRYAIVGRKELEAVVQDINQVGSTSDSVNPLGDLFDRASSDLLAVGEVSLKGDKLVIAFKLMESETGRIVSATQQSFKRKGNNQDSITPGLSLEGAAQKAAQLLMRDVVRIDKVLVQGVRYQTSGVHTQFGRYFMEVLSDALRQSASRGPRNINDMSISSFSVEEEVFRGLKLAKTSVEQASLSANDKDYILSGTYWVFPDYLDLRLKLKQGSGKSVSWRGRVLKSEIPPNLALLPPPPPVEKTVVSSMGPMGLYLSSNKGQDPLFKTGETMVLAVRSDRDAYLGCYYLQADGSIFRIFPNQFAKETSLKGQRKQYIPSRNMPFAFEFTPPSGIEGVKCYATDVDVLDDVSAQIGKAAFEPLKVNSERELTKIYRSLRNIALSEAELIVTVE